VGRSSGSWAIKEILVYIAYTKTPQKPLYRISPDLSRIYRIYSLSYLFRKLRIHKNLTKKALAQRIGFTEEYVYRIEKDEKLPSFDYAVKCAELFEINPEWVKRKWLKEFLTWFEERVRRILEIEN